MIKTIEFILNDPDPKEKWYGFFAIQTNVMVRLKRISRLRYSKWTIVISNGHPMESTIDTETEKTLSIHLLLDFSSITSCKERKDILRVYQMMSLGLQRIWALMNWDGNEITNLFKAIETDDYKVSATYGKSYLSPDKKHKAELYCELYPDYADCYVKFLTKAGVELKKIHFLKGSLNPDDFFGFFTQIQWRDNEHFFIMNFSREIFYVFNIESDIFNIEFSPKENNLEELNNYVKAFQYGVSHEERMRLFGLPIRK